MNLVDEGELPKAEKQDPGNRSLNGAPNSARCVVQSLPTFTAGHLRTPSSIHHGPEACLTPVYNDWKASSEGFSADSYLLPDLMAVLAVPAVDPVIATTFAISVASQLAIFYGTLSMGWLVTQKQKSWVLSTYTRSATF
jgi:hypothetical protein